MSKQAFHKLSLYNFAWLFIEYPFVHYFDDITTDRQTSGKYTIVGSESKLFGVSQLLMERYNEQIAIYGFQEHLFIVLEESCELIDRIKKYFPHLELLDQKEE